MALKISRALHVYEKCFIKYWKRISLRCISTNAEELQPSQRKVNFGFQTETEEEKVTKWKGVFSTLALNYDTMNDVMSGGLHRLWRDHFINTLNPVPGTRLLDVAGGTGDIAFRFLEFIRKSSKSHTLDGELISISSGISEEPLTDVTVCDINPDMMKVGKDRAKSIGLKEDEVTWVTGDAEKLPFEENTFDYYTISFGIRYVPHIDKVFEEAYRVLKPGGRFLCMEFNHISNPLIGPVIHYASFRVAPVVGFILTGDWKLGQYLVESIASFPKAELLEAMLVRGNFRNVYHEKLHFGAIAIYSGFKMPI